MLVRLHVPWPSPTFQFHASITTVYVYVQIFILKSTAMTLIILTHHRAQQATAILAVLSKKGTQFACLSDVCVLQLKSFFFFF